MIVLALEEFAARRHKAQRDVEDYLRPIVEESVDLTENTDGWSLLLDAVEEAYGVVFLDEAGEGPVPALPSGWRTELADTLKETRSPRTEATVDRITVWLATWVLSQATIAAVGADEEFLLLEWVDMADTDVRPSHRKTAGQQRPPGEPFDVDGVEMPYPGWPGAPIELWINCRCTLRPTLPESEAVMAHQMRDVSREERERDADAGRALPDGSFPIDNCSDLKNAIQAIGRAKDPAKAKAHIRKRKNALGCPDVDLPDTWAEESLAAAADEREANTVIVALPAEGEAVNSIGQEQKHVTLAFLGEYDGDADELADAVAQVAAAVPGPFTAQVSGSGSLGPDKAAVWFVEAQEIADLRTQLMAAEAVAVGVEAADTHPHFVPHMTVGYRSEGDDFDAEAVEGVSEITLDRIAVWHGEDQTEYALGGVVDENEHTEVEETEENMAGLIPWHGVIAPEGKPSGDGRGFTLGAMRARPLPLPLTYQKTSDDGHKGNVTVARIDRMVRVPTGDGEAEIRATGFMRSTPEADEVVGLLADFDGRFGVSVDADETTFELDEDTETVWFTDSRSCSACIVSIPAFAEAWVSLGEAPDDFMDGEDLSTDGPAVVEAEALVASVVAVPEADMFVDVAPGKTEDGPGWLTHPVDTDRLRDYWVRGPGAAKIGWGAPGDFNRCRVNVAEYVKPQHLNGYCANRHYDALGYWPGQGPHAASEGIQHMQSETEEHAEPLTLVASALTAAPADWFADPGLTEATPVTVTDDGRVFGHLATWDSCHIGFPDTCTAPPRSMTNYAYFLTGEVCLDNGSRVSCGNITIGGGHAPSRAGLRAAVEHYDSTSTVVCDVAAGEDHIGIWVAGRVRPGTPEEMVAALQASALSGDWRKVGGNLELVAALAVNVPGFPIPRTKVAASSEGQMSLVAAGVVQRTEPTSLPFDVEAFVDAIAERIETRRITRERMAAVAARVEALTAVKPVIEKVEV